MEFISVLSMTNPSQGRESLNVHFTFVFPSSPPPCSSQSSAVLGFPAFPASGLGCAGPALPLLNFLVPSSSEKSVQRDGPEREPSTGKRKGWLQKLFLVFGMVPPPRATKTSFPADPWGWSRSRSSEKDQALDRIKPVLSS